MTIRVPSGRWIALQALLALDDPQTTAEEALARAWVESGVPMDLVPTEQLGRERGLALELTLGVLRWERRLDGIVDRLVKRGNAGDLHPAVCTLLHLGLYQLIFLDRIPAHAAVSETVALTRPAHVEFATGFINASLRRFLREKEQLEKPSRRGPAALAEAWSWPDWVVEPLSEVLRGDLAAFLATGVEQPPITLRVNTTRISTSELEASLIAAQIPVVRGNWCDSALSLTERSGSPARLPGFREGHFWVQDEAAQVVGELADIQPGMTVLDACAAPGGKTFQLALRLQGTGTLWATDISASRLAKLVESAQRLGLPGEIKVRVKSWGGDAQTGRGPGAPPLVQGELGGVDVALVDAPCSGLGVVRRVPEIKRWRQASDIPRYVERQCAILEEVGGRVKRGGQLVYAVCSPLPEEGPGVIAWFLRRFADFHIEDPRTRGGEYAWFNLLKRDGTLSTWPHRHGTDAFFAVRLRRRV